MTQAQYRRHRKGESGFTLIELLVVIAVLAILATIVIFNVTGVKNKGQTSACQTDTKSVQTAYDSYLNDGGTAWTAGDVTSDVSQLVPTYIHTAPSSCTKYTLTGGTITGA